MTRICRYLSLLFLLLFCMQFANAQSQFDLNVGFGSAQDKSLGSVDVNTLNPCTTGSLQCATTPDLKNFMLGFGMNLMLWKHFGVGGVIDVQPGRQDYLVFSPSGAGQVGDVLQDRITFYDFNGIFRPFASKRADLQLFGGIGGAHVSFYEKFTANSAVLGNSQQTQFAGSSNHFQVHGGVGVQIYLNDHFFMRPQVQVRDVHNFSQFGRDLVTEESVFIGYSWGDR